MGDSQHVVKTMKSKKYIKFTYIGAKTSIDLLKEEIMYLLYFKKYFIAVGNLLLNITKKKSTTFQT
jgi:hypothetical protein